MSGITHGAALAMLRARGQEHLLRFYDELGESGRRRLLEQIDRLDWDELETGIREQVLGADSPTCPPDDLAPAPYLPLHPETSEQNALYERARERGRELLRSGAVAGFTVAGGQGTRLGYDAPKGTFPVSPVKAKTLFQLFAEALLRAREKYGAPIPWYVMTSPVNDQATRAFFEEHGWFGLPPSEILCFPQGAMPAINHRGKLLLAAPDSLALSPNGHGGSLQAMRTGGALDHMAQRGVRHISYWQVDNPLVYPFDPLFIGLHDILESDMSSRSLTKAAAEEKLGAFCLTGGNLAIVEYSDLPPELMYATEGDGRLRYRAGSPAIHLLRREFVEKLTSGELRLPWHRAEKAVPYLDANGNLIRPESPNAVKLEMFIFDALPLARNPLVLEADRSEQFSPLKNATGPDSIDTCRRAQIERAAAWLTAAGVPVPRNPDGSPDAVLEFSPRRFLDPEDVAQQAHALRPPERGATVYYG